MWPSAGGVPTAEGSRLESESPGGRLMASGAAHATRNCPPRRDGALGAGRHRGEPRLSGTV
eukprot:190937-Alexandrium_andersonii.AAC.1